MSAPRLVVGLACGLVACTLSGCSQPRSGDLAAALKGMEEAKFVQCAGPPLLTRAANGQQQMSFVTDLKRGSAIGIASPLALAPTSCSVDAVFQDGRLASAQFSGDAGTCNQVFAPCIGR